VVVRFAIVKLVVAAGLGHPVRDWSTEPPKGLISPMLVLPLGMVYQLYHSGKWPLFKE